MAWQMAVVVALVLLARHALLRKKSRLIVKQVLVSIPVAALGLMLFASAVRSSMGNVMYDIHFGNLLFHAEEIGEGIDIGRFRAIDWERPLQNPYYEELRKELEGHSRGEAVAWNNVQDGASGKSETYTSAWLLRVQEGEVYTAFCQRNYINLNNRYIDREMRYWHHAEALRTGEASVGRMHESQGEGYWLNVFYPLKDEGGEVVAIIEVGMPSQSIDAAVQEMIGELFAYVALTLGLSLLVCIVVLGISLRALGALEQGARQIAKGEYGVRVHVRTTDETKRIATAFNQMAESVETSYRDMKLVRDGYRNFVPEKMLLLLQEQSIAQVRAGTQTALHATDLLLSIEGLEAQDKGRAYVDALNGLYSCVLPHIVAAQGLVERYGNESLHALFDSPPEVALRALIAVFASLDKREESARCHAFLSRQETVLGVIGDEKRQSMIAVNRVAYQAPKVATMCARLGCRVVLSRGARADLGQRAGAYRNRLIGYLLDGGERAPLYDFYDAEPPALMQGKEATQAAFEQGIELYYEGAYAAARRLFIEVIKKSPLDVAAREYLRESHERQLSGQGPGMLLEI